MINLFLPKTDVFTIVSLAFINMRQDWNNKKQECIFRELVYQSIYKDDSNLSVMGTDWLLFNGFNNKISLKLINCSNKKTKHYKNKMNIKHGNRIATNTVLTKCGIFKQKMRNAHEKREAEHFSHLSEVNKVTQPVTANVCCIV